MIRIICTNVLIFSLLLPVGAQEELDIDHEQSCCYVSKLDPEIKIYSFENDADARLAVKRIMAYSGLEPNFLITAANVPNAAAVIQKDKRLILYSQEFMERIKSQAKTDWAAYAIMAHEIGHHLQGHTLTKEGSRPRLELQADKYSGYVLGLMGASLDEAISALKTLSPGPGSETHPSRSARLAAGTNGWKKAQETLNRSPQRASDAGAGVLSPAGKSEDQGAPQSPVADHRKYPEKIRRISPLLS